MGTDVGERCQGLPVPQMRGVIKELRKQEKAEKQVTPEMKEKRHAKDCDKQSKVDAATKLDTIMKGAKAKAKRVRWRVEGNMQIQR